MAIPILNVRRTSVLVTLLIVSGASLLHANDAVQSARKLTERMFDALERGNAEEAISLGQRLVKGSPKDPLPAYNLACVYARCKQPDEAITWLQTSAELGFSYLATFQRDQDLVLLREHAEFPEIAARIKRNSDAALEQFKKNATNPRVMTFFPPDHDPKKPVPLVVALHGYGTDARDIVSVWRQPATRNGAILIAPEAVTRAGSGYSWGVIEHARYLVLQAMERTKKKHLIDEQRIVLTGFSQGGSISFVLGIRDAERFAGIIPMAGYYDHDLTPVPDRVPDSFPRFFIMNGANDGQADNNREAARRLKSAGAETEIRIYEGIGHGIPHNHFKELTDALRFILE